MVCLWDVTVFQKVWENHSRIIQFLFRSGMIFLHNFPQHSKYLYLASIASLLSFRKIVFLILLFLLVRLQEAHPAISGGDRHHSLPDHNLSQKYIVLNIQEHTDQHGPTLKRGGHKKRSELWEGSPCRRNVRIIMK